MDVNFEDWSFWATENKVHQDVIGYLTYSKADLFDFDPKTSSQSFATPRSWNFVSEILNTEGSHTAPTLSKRQKLLVLLVKGWQLSSVNTERLLVNFNPEDVPNGQVQEVR